MFGRSAPGVDPSDRGRLDLYSTFSGYGFCFVFRCVFIRPLISPDDSVLGEDGKEVDKQSLHMVFPSRLVPRNFPCLIRRNPGSFFRQMHTYTPVLSVVTACPDTPCHPEQRDQKFIQSLSSFCVQENRTL